MILRARTIRITLLIAIFGFALGATTATAQLVECAQVDSGGNVNAPGGCIARTLQDQIGAGQGDVNTPGSSIYLIRRDPARSIRRGRQLFQRKFTVAEGSGPRGGNASSTGDITQVRTLGAGLADSCAACHGRPRGSAGFGGDVNTFPDSRDSPHLFGLGLVEMLSDEMTSDLRAIRDQAIIDAQGGGTGGTILDADFDDDSDGFAFGDDPFGTNNPAYASGQRIFGAPGDGVLSVSLGGIDNADIFGMSGGWSRTINVAAATAATLDFRFQLNQTADYESDEFSEARVRVNGTEFLLATITGNGNGGGGQTTGQQDVTLGISLNAGANTITFGAFNNKKTFFNETTTAFFNNVVIVGAGGPGPVTRSLDTKGVNFGSITAFPDSSLDTSQVEGVDANLRVKPFFAQGATITMREFIVGALNGEMGLQAWDPVLCAATDPSSPQMVTSPAGFVYDPSEDTFERPPACNAGEDPDGDGVAGEIDPALVDHMEFYLLNYFKAGQHRVTARAQQGRALMDSVGCTSCHIADLTINSDRRVADVETVYDPVNGIFNELFATASTRFGTPIDDGDPFPQLPPSLDSFVVRNIFTDFKRHDLGPAFEERDFDGTRLLEHVTEPLWGVGSTSPYGHDGRSINLDLVIRRHGGEAAGVTLAYAQLSDNEQRKIQEFLSTLVLFPPDDTASNLNPGDPNTTDPQVPGNHGSINLGALFQIPSEGPE